MDAPEADFDIKLQKISADLLEDFDRSLPHFLWKPDGHGGTRIRSRVLLKTCATTASLQAGSKILAPPKPGVPTAVATVSGWISQWAGGETEDIPWPPKTAYQDWKMR